MYPNLRDPWPRKRNVTVYAGKTESAYRKYMGMLTRRVAAAVAGRGKRVTHRLPTKPIKRQFRDPFVVHQQSWEKEGCIYMVPCACGAKFVGVTTKQFLSRLADHLEACLSLSPSSDAGSRTYQEHTTTCGSHILWESAQYLLPTGPAVRVSAVQFQPSIQAYTLESVCIKTLNATTPASIHLGPVTLPMLAPHVVLRV